MHFNVAKFPLTVHPFLADGNKVKRALQSKNLFVIRGNFLETILGVQFEGRKESFVKPDSDNLQTEENSLLMVDNWAILGFFRKTPV